MKVRPATANRNLSAEEQKLRAEKVAETEKMKELGKGRNPADFTLPRGSSTGGSRGPITQPGPMPRPTIPRDIGLGNGPRGLPPKGSGTSTGGYPANPRPMPAIGNLPAPTGPYAGKVVTDPNVKSMAMKKGGKVKSTSSYKSGGSVKSSASKRGDGIAQRGKTKGRMV